MAATTPDQAQEANAQQVHGAATQALAAVSKLAGLLKQAGADNDTVKTIDEMANTLNQITSVAVGNTPTDSVSPEPSAPGGDLKSAIQEYHGQAIAQGQA